MINTTGATGSYPYADITHTGDKQSSTVVTNISPAIPSTWQVGYYVTGGANGYAAGTTISAICTGLNAPVAGCVNAFSLILNQVTLNNGNGDFMSVTSTNTAASATAGGNTDPYYSPSYIGASYQNPGLGGTTAANVNGHAGAVVFLW